MAVCTTMPQCTYCRLLPLRSLAEGAGPDTSSTVGSGATGAGGLSGSGAGAGAFFLPLCFFLLCLFLLFDGASAGGSTAGAKAAGGVAATGGSTAGAWAGAAAGGSVAGGGVTGGGAVTGGGTTGGGVTGGGVTGGGVTTGGGADTGATTGGGLTGATAGGGLTGATAGGGLTGATGATGVAVGAGVAGTGGAWAGAVGTGTGMGGAGAAVGDVWAAAATRRAASTRRRRHGRSCSAMMLLLDVYSAMRSNPAFAIVNKATGLAVKHSLGQGHPVKLVPYNPEYLDESVMWTESGDVGKGFRCIRMVNNTRLNFDALNGDKDHGGVHDGTTIVLWEWAKGDNQSWKILPWGEEAYAGGSANAPRGGSSEPTVRIFCKADEGFSATVRNGEVVLAPTNPRDEHQHWFKDMRHSNKIKDEEGCPAFALVNKVTGQAIKHSQGEGHPVKLVPYNPNYQDESVLWTESRDVGAGFRCIRMVNNIYLNFDALNGDKDHGGVRDGTALALWKWCEGDNQRWKILPW